MILNIFLLVLNSIIITVFQLYRQAYKVKIKVKFTLEQATKAQKGSRCIAVLFL